jgi:LPS sulfotransferase NodH
MALWRTGVCGAPLEYLNIKNRQTQIEQYGGAELWRYWEHIKHTRTSENGCFGFKMFNQDYRTVAEFDDSVLPEIWSHKVVYLTRNDRVGQAVSYARAIKTGQWFAGAYGGGAGDFNIRDIDHCMNSLAEQYTAWDLLFEATGGTPLRIAYEDISANVDDVVAKIVRYIGVSEDKGNVVNLPELEKQGDRLNERWKELYLEFGG